jgi:hypothetical protein
MAVGPGDLEAQAAPVDRVVQVAVVAEADVEARVVGTLEASRPKRQLED